MLKKLIRLNINDLWLCLGVVAFFFLAAQVITGAVLLLAEGVHSVPLVSWGGAAHRGGDHDTGRLHLPHQRQLRPGPPLRPDPPAGPWG